jgi:hypothetical protein
MIRGKQMVRAAALGALACGGVAGASEVRGGAGAAALDAASEMRLDRPVYLQEEDKGRRPLMAAADRVGAADLFDDIGIDISGHVAVGYTWSFGNPPDAAGGEDFLVGRAFDVQHDELLLHQADVAIQRTLTPDDDQVTGYADKFNLGFKAEVMYGYDARFIHSNGLLDHYTDDASRNEEWDLTQAYLTAGIPVGNGLLITAGKFVTLIGKEYINPTQNALYSHSYLFGFAIPFTHTGVMARYNFTEEFNVTGGIVRGWEQSNEDNNEAESFLASVGYTWNPGEGSEPVNITLTGITGPEQADNEGDYRTLIDLIIETKVGDQLAVGLNADWAYEEGSEFNDEGEATGGDAQWYGVAAYAQYDPSAGGNKQFLINARAEWFSDKYNTRGIGTNVYEATLGLAIKPFPENDLGSNITFRPEVRYDYAQEGLFDGGTQHDQLTVGADILFTF